MATTRSKIVAELIGTAGTIDTAKLTDNAVTVAKLATTLDLSSSTVSLPLGVGGTDWSSAVKSSNFTAEANKGYYLNTSGGVITVTLPTSGLQTGQIVSLVDVTATADTNKILINPNGNKLNGAAFDLEITSERSGLQLTYSGSTYGWIATETANETSTQILLVTNPIITSFANSAGEQYFQADGNTITITGRNFKSSPAATVTFTSDDGNTFAGANVNVVSDTSITVDIPSPMTADTNADDDQDPFTITVTNSSPTKASSAATGLEWLPTPTFSVNGTTGGTNFGRFLRGDAISSLILNGSPVAVSATSLDADDTVTIATSPQTGTLPAGISISSSGTFSGTLTGPAAGKTSHTFTLRATAVSGSESLTADSPSYTIEAFGTRVESVDPTIFDGSANSTFTITGKGFNGSPAVKTAGNGGVKFVGTGVGNSFTQNAGQIFVDSDTQMRVTTSANISPTDVGSGLDIHVTLDNDDLFKLSHESNPVFITAPLGITAGTPTTLTNTITSALRGQPLTGTDFVIPAATDANGGSIASYALNTAFSATDGADISWLSFNPSNRQITGTVPSSYITGGGSITVPIRITDNAGNTLDQDYTITVASQGFSYPLGISHSALFDGSSNYLNRTPSTITNSSQTTWTYSAWIKKNANDTFHGIFSSSDPAVSGNRHGFYIGIESNNKIRIIDTQTSNSMDMYTTQVFRDTSSWYHIVLKFNTTVSSPTLELYVNGSPITSFSTSTYPTSGTSYSVNNTWNHLIGVKTYNGSINAGSNAYMANIDFIDGQALSAEYFGKTQDGVWVAKAFNGDDNAGNSATNDYGTNGFKLTFADSGDLGKDTAPLTTGSGNKHTAANNWTNN